MDKTPLLLNGNLKGQHAYPPLIHTINIERCKLCEKQKK